MGTAILVLKRKQTLPPDCRFRRQLSRSRPFAASSQPSLPNERLRQLRRLRWLRHLRRQRQLCHRWEWDSTAAGKHRATVVCAATPDASCFAAAAALALEAWSTARPGKMAAGRRFRQSPPLHPLAPLRPQTTHRPSSPWYPLAPPVPQEVLWRRNLLLQKNLARHSPPRLTSVSI